MPPKQKKVYVCKECGYESPKWNGRCPNCEAWNSFEEEVRTPTAAASGLGGKAPAQVAHAYQPLRLRDVDFGDEARYDTGIGELNRVLGGGLVKGSVVLLSGDPGIGKSTLLLQICAHLGQAFSILYVSGEESIRQLGLRAGRLGVTTDNLYLVAETDIFGIQSTILSQKPDIVMIDSIQTMNMSTLSSSPGSITQVRECTNLLLRLAKSEEIPIFIVGHVNKDGVIAGPKVLEHIVDAVLYFEGERHLSYRILRAVKNRFGSTNEIGVFEMSGSGLIEVENPSSMMLAGRPTDVSGTCVACIIEGSRPILAEVQVLAAKTAYGNPRRMATGFDFNRMALLLAVLEKRAGFAFSQLDTYINVIGGLKLDEPAADLSVVLALASSVLDRPVPDDLIAFGEVGLAGEVRGVSYAGLRLSEASRLGFSRCILPAHNMRQLEDRAAGIELIPVRSITQAFRVL